jgi:hypothetical protein
MDRSTVSTFGGPSAKMSDNYVTFRLFTHADVDLSPTISQLIQHEFWLMFHWTFSTRARTHTHTKHTCIKIPNHRPGQALKAPGG